MIRAENRGGVATVTLDRPPVNALTSALYVELGELFNLLGKDMSVHCALLVSASEKAFSAGKDLNEFLATTVEDDPAQALIVRTAFSAILHCHIPVIAVVNGPALGAGCVIASVCDIRMASPKATFGLPEINVGRCGGGAHLGRLIPQGALRRMAFTGEPISAAEAYRIGLVDVLVEPERLLDEAQALAAAIASKSPLGLRLGKQALGLAETLPLEEGYACEQAFSTKLMRAEDGREAARAFVEKRTPVFVGR
jgi:enoyl-CoA hydratase